MGTYRFPGPTSKGKPPPPPRPPRFDCGETPDDPDWGSAWDYDFEGL